MKKTTRIAALLAAAALIFGGLFFSCSDSDDGGNGNDPSPNPDPTPTPNEAKAFDWDASNYFAEYPKGSPALTEDKEFGELTIGAKNKVTNNGTFDITVDGETIAVAGYAQINHSSNGTVTFTAPKDTDKISIWAKLDATTKVLEFKTGGKDGDTIEGAKFTGESDMNYKEYSFKPTFTQDTVITLINSGSSSANFKYVKVSVKKPEVADADKVYAKAVAIGVKDGAVAEVNVGGTLTLTAAFTADDPKKTVTETDLTWASSDPEMASISKGGVVTGKKAGNVTITAAAKDADGNDITSNPLTVTVKNVDVTGITLDKPTAEITVGDTLKLTATVAPNNATDKTVTWASDNETVATVADGTVTAIAEGTATITAAAGGKTAACTVTLKAKPEGAGKISYFTEATSSVSATQTGDTISGSEVTFVFDVEGFSVGKTSEDTTNNGIKVACTSNVTNVSVEQNKIIGYAQFTVTAQKACKITKIEATTVQSQSSNIGTAIFLGEETEPKNTVSGGKTSMTVADLSASPITLAANETKTVKVALYTTKAWTKEDASKKVKCDMSFANIVVTAESN